jgi:hypothetical protein
MTRAVHVPFTVEQDEDEVWCAHAQLRRGVGANGEGTTRAEAVAAITSCAALTAVAPRCQFMLDVTWNILADTGLTVEDLRKLI